MTKHIVGLEVIRLGHLIVRALEKELVSCVDGNMSATTARIICLLVENKDRDVFQKDIEEFLYLKKSSVSLILNNMEQGNFIVRQSVSHDARLNKIACTPKAEAYYIKITTAFDRIEQLMSVNIEDKSLFVDTLQNIQNSLSQ